MAQSVQWAYQTGEYNLGQPDQVRSKGIVSVLQSSGVAASTSHPYGLYNVINPQPVRTSQILELMSEYGLENPNWKYITLDELYKSTSAKRSNCVLSDGKISKLNLKLPNTIESLTRSVATMASTRDDQQNQRFIK